MNLTECRIMQKYLKNGEYKVLEAYLEDKEQELIIKNEKSKEKAAVEAVHKIRNYSNSAFFPIDDGRFILGFEYSIFVLNSDELVKEYNKMASNIKQNKFRYRPFDIAFESDYVKNDVVPKLKRVYEILGKKEYHEISSMKEIEKPSRDKKKTTVELVVSSKDALVTRSFNKIFVDHARKILGKNVIFSMNENVPLLYGQSEKGKVYIFGINPNKKPKVEEA